MIAKGGLKIFFFLLLSAATTGAIYSYEQSRAESVETAAALRWARQIVAQAEGMELAAREKGEKNPLSWAVDYLAQGVEPRTMIVRRLPAGTTPSETSEAYQLDRKTGQFEYSRILNLQNGSGIRIYLDLKGAGILQGFLGSQTQLTEDAALASVFLGVYLLCWALVSLFGNRTEEPLPQLNLNEISHAPSFTTQPAPKLPPKREPTSAHAKTSVNALGVEIRNLLKQAHVMTVAMKNSGIANQGMREKVQSHLNRLHSNRKLLKEVTRLIGQAESLIDVAEPGIEQKQLHSLLEKVKDLSVGSERAFRDLEVQIEPFIVDADLAAEAYQKALGAADQMGENIRKTKEQLARHIRIIQNNLPSPASDLSA